MFDLEKAISEWKKAMRRSPSIDEADLAELERYMRDKVEDLAAAGGLSQEEAFLRAVEEFRRAGALDAAYGHARSARPGRRFPWTKARLSPGLLWSNVRIALRRLRLQRAYAVINIGGMALGLACTLLIFLWVRDETSYDRFHDKADRIYRVVLSTDDDGQPSNANGSFGLGPALKKDFPEVEDTVRVRKMEQNPKRYVGYGDKKFYEPRFFYAEPSLFMVFDFPLVRGDAATALRDPGSVVLTEAMAAKYFGNEDPIGRVIEADPYNDGKPVPFRVTGVAKNVPRQSHFHFDFLASYSGLREDTTQLSGMNQHYTYVLLRPGASAAAMAPRFIDFLKRNWQENPWYTIGLQPLRDIHLHSGLRSEIEPTGDIMDVYIFSAVALAVLLIACINFMNLATARSAKRAKEVGIRKAVGAPRSQLVRQFLGESLSTSAVSTAGAFLIVAAVLPWLNRLTGKGLTAATLAAPSVLLAAAAVAIAVGLVSGLYPALFLSAFRPVQILRAQGGPKASGAFLRRALVVLQFALSIGILCATLVIRDQMTYIRSRDLGFDRDQILAVPLNGEVRANYEAFRNELMKDPGVENAAASAFVPTGGSAHYNMNFEGGTQGITQVVYMVDKNFFATYGHSLLAGRTTARLLSEEGPNEILLSASSVREAGYASPEEALGKIVDIDDLMLMTVNNPATGPESAKAGMYIEANIHGNEIQGGEVCLYTIWYLMENYGRLADVTRLVDERVFYIIPTVNPDGRQYFMESPGGNARSGHVPVDDDNDGVFDEDPPEDVNGNGIVEQIRKSVPGQGNYRISRTNPDILEPVPYGEKGDYILLGQEGVDNDGDGMVNEDGPGSYDGNRNWPSDWQPNYVQSGAMDYPFQLPEAKAVADFLKDHRNIAGVQSYHNSGGMILRGPGAEAVGEYPATDVRFYDELGRNGERILPFYRYIVLWSGLYTVHGGFIDYTNDGLGIISFSNELWSNDQYFTSPALKDEQADPSSPIAPAQSRYYFDKRLEFGDEFVEWKSFDHPQFGPVEMGGVWKKFQGRVPPRFMNEELCHRNMAFSLYQADEMPLIRMTGTEVEKIGGNVYRVFVDIANPRVAPTIMARAAQNGTVRPDLLLVEGKGVEVIAASFVDNKAVYQANPSVTPLVDQKDLKRIIVRNGHPGKTTRTAVLLVKGSGTMTVTYDSVKGGRAGATVTLK